MRLAKSDCQRRGSSLLEFALAGSFILLPLLAGLSTVGFQMIVSMQAEGLTRDAGHMYALGVDFTQSSNQQLLQNLATTGSLSLTPAGNGVVIFSEISNTAGQVACIDHLTVGNSGLRNSSFVDASNNVLPAFTSIMSLAPGQVAYVVETYFSTPSLAWTGLLPGTGGGVYNKAIF